MTAAKQSRGKRRPHVWVVEGNFGEWDDPDRWEPTIGCGLTLYAARIELRDWKAVNTGTRFRLRKYARTAAREGRREGKTK